MCLLSQYDGVENDNFIPYLLDLVNQGSKTTPVFDISIPEQFWVPDERWLNYLPGSNWAEVVIWGKTHTLISYITLKMT